MGELTFHLKDFDGPLELLLRPGHHAGVLVDQLQDGDVVQVHLEGLHPGQQQLQRAVAVLRGEGSLTPAGTPPRRSC